LPSSKQARLSAKKSNSSISSPLIRYDDLKGLLVEQNTVMWQEKK